MEFSIKDNWIEMSPDMRAAADRMGPFSRHALFHFCCQQLYKAQGGQAPDPDGVLATRGFTVARDLIGGEEIADLRAMIDASLAREAEPFQPTSRNPGYNVAWQDADKARAAQILFKAVSGPVEKTLFDYFGSNFFIRTVTAGRLFPSEKSTVSYQWHRDGEVPQQVHIILYLTDLSEKHGSTELLTLDDTKAVAGAGYDFPLVKDRKSDLSEECRRGGCDYAPNRIEAKAGDALVFTPNRVLHRGAQPTEGSRDVMLAVVLPCPMPWNLTLQHNYPHIFVPHHLLNAGSDPFERYQPKWDIDKVPGWVRGFRMTPPDWGAGARE